MTMATIIDLPRDLLNLIASYAIDPIYKLLDWIDVNKLDWEQLSQNERAYDLLKNNFGKIKWDDVSCVERKIILLMRKYLNKFDWDSLAHNDCDEAIELLREHPDKINWALLSWNNNINGIELLKSNPGGIDWNALSGNRNAIEILKTHPDKINWDNLLCIVNSGKYLYPLQCQGHPSPHYLQLIELLRNNSDKIIWKNIRNDNPHIIELLKAYPDKINWNELSRNENPQIIELLKAYPDKINWNELSRNENTNVIEFLKENLDKINWDTLSKNKNAIELLKKHLDKINWNCYFEHNSNSNDLLSDFFEIIEKKSMDVKLLDKIDNAVQYCEKRKWQQKSLETTDVKLLRANIDKIDWFYLVLNQCDDVIQILKENADKISWKYVFDFRCIGNSKILDFYPDKFDFFDLTINPGIIDVMKENKHCADESNFFTSPLIFEIDDHGTKNKINKYVLKMINVISKQNIRNAQKCNEKMY